MSDAEKNKGEPQEEEEAQEQAQDSKDEEMAEEVKEEKADGKKPAMSKAKKEALSKRIRTAASKTKRKAAAGGSGAADPLPRKKKSPVTHPRTLDMAIEAIEKLDDAKGVSVPAIRAYILETYETVRPDMIKSMLKAGLEQGFKENLLTRPRGQENVPLLSGRYKVTKKGGKQAFLNEKSMKKKAKSKTAAKTKAVAPKVESPKKKKKGKVAVKIQPKPKKEAPVEVKKTVRKPPTNRSAAAAAPAKKKASPRKRRK